MIWLLSGWCRSPPPTVSPSSNVVNELEYKAVVVEARELVEPEMEAKMEAKVRQEEEKEAEAEAPARLVLHPKPMPRRRAEPQAQLPGLLWHQQLLGRSSFGCAKDRLRRVCLNS